MDQLFQWLSKWPYIPDFISFVLAFALGCLGFFESPGKKLGAFRHVIIAFLILAAGLACVTSIALKRQASQSDKEDRKQREQYESSLRTQLEGMKGTIEDDIRTKEAHPLILAAYAPMGRPEVGAPFGVRLNLIITGSKDATFLNKSGWQLLPINSDVTEQSNSERQNEEKDIWQTMIDRPALTMHLPYGKEGSASLPLMTNPLTQDQVDAFESGHALIYFMSELRNPTTNKIVLSFCKFVDVRGNTNGCFEHDTTDAER